jgi:twitching motility protein PilU
MAMERLPALMADKRASVVFIAAGSRVQLRINGTTVPINQQRLYPAAVDALLREILTDRQWAQFEQDPRRPPGWAPRPEQARATTTSC